MNAITLTQKSRAQLHVVCVDTLDLKALKLKCMDVSFQSHKKSGKSLLHKFVILHAGKKLLYTQLLVFICAASNSNSVLYSSGLYQPGWCLPARPTCPRPAGPAAPVWRPAWPGSDAGPRSGTPAAGYAPCWPSPDSPCPP